MEKIRESQPYSKKYIPLPSFSNFSIRSHLAFLICLLTLLIIYRETLLGMEHQWSVSSAHGHGYLIAPISFWLAYRKRRQLQTARIRPTPYGLLALLASAAVWLVGEIASINILSYTGLVAMVPSLLLLFYGPAILHTLRFPLAFLFFMVPAGDFLIPYLMKGTTEATVWALVQTGLPVYKEGNHLSLPTGRWSVIETCAGLNYIIAAGVLGTLYAHLTYTRLYKQVLFLCSIMIMALIANWVRAYLTIMAGHLTNMQWGPGREHVTFGWIIFGIIIGLLFWICSKWADTEASENTNNNARTEHTPLAGISDTNANDVKKLSPTAVIAPLFAVSALSIVLAVQFSSTGVFRSPPEIDEFLKLNISRELLPTDKSDFIPEFSGYRAKFEGQATDGVQIFIGYYANQIEGFEIVSSENRLIQENGEWISLSNTLYTVQNTGPQELQVREAIVQRGNNQFLVWYWYTTRRSETTSSLKLKLDTLKTTLIGQGDRAALLSISSPISDSGLPEAREKLSKVVVKARQTAFLLMQP
jgi:exosortase A